MDFRRLISSGSRLARRLCSTASAPAAPREAEASASASASAAATVDGVAASSAAASVAAAWAKKGIPPKKHHAVYRRLSRIDSTGTTVAQTLNQFIMEGNAVRKDELFRCVRELRRFRKHQHALEVIEWMERRKMQFSVTDQALRLDLIAKTKGLEAAEIFFESLEPSAQNQLTHGALLNCYCVELKEEKAAAQFRRMDDLQFVNNSLPFTNMMSMYMRLGQPEKVPSLVDAMRQRNITPSGIAYSIWMQSCGSLNDIDGVEKVLEEMAKDDEDKSTWNTFANLAAIYTKAGLYEKAELALKSLEEKMNPQNRDSYHFLLSLYAGTSNHSEVHRVWNSLQASLPEVNNTSYLVMLQALNRLKDTDGVQKIFAEWESRCWAYDMRLANMAIKSYLERNMYEEAMAILDNATSRSKGPFSKARELLIIHLLNNDQVDLALKHLEALSSESKDDWKCSQELLNAVFLHFEKAKDVDGAEEFCRKLRKFMSLDSHIYTLLLKIYIAAGETSLDMRGRLEREEIEVTDEIQELLAKVCPS